VKSLYPWLRSRLVPDLENSHVTYARALQRVVTPRLRWLELGCGHSLVPDWMPHPPDSLWRRAVGVDVDTRALQQHAGLKHRIAGDAQRLPFRDETFDLITANMVVEHVTDPTALFSELHRVLRPGGRVLIHTPNATGYTTRLARLCPEPIKAMLAAVMQRRAVDDVYPAFYRVNTEEALNAAASPAGLSVDECEYVLTTPQLLRVPGLVIVEMLWIRHIARADKARKRPVLIVTLAKAAPSAAVAVSG